MEHVEAWLVTVEASQVVLLEVVMVVAVDWLAVVDWLAELVVTVGGEAEFCNARPPPSNLRSRRNDPEDQCQLPHLDHSRAPDLHEGRRRK